MNQPVSVLDLENQSMKSFAELTGKEKSTERLRWVCVPAAAVLGVLVLRVIAGFVMTPVLAQLPGSAAMPASDFLERSLACASCWYVSRLVGTVRRVARLVGFADGVRD